MVYYFDVIGCRIKEMHASFGLHNAVVLSSKFS